MEEYEGQNSEKMVERCDADEKHDRRDGGGEV